MAVPRARALSSPRRTAPSVRPGGHVRQAPLTRPEVIEALRARFREGKPFSGAPTRVHQAAVREFRTWSDAMTVATTTTGPGAITPTDVVLVLRRLARQRPNMTTLEIERSLFAPAIRRHFASTAEAADAAGLVGWPRHAERVKQGRGPVQPAPQPRPVSRKNGRQAQIAQVLRQRLARGDVLDQGMQRGEPSVLPGAADQLDAIDLRYAAIRGASEPLAPPLTARAVLALLRPLVVGGRAVAPANLAPHVRRAARHHFGTFAAAVAAARRG